MVLSMLLPSRNGGDSMRMGMGSLLDEEEQSAPTARDYVQDGLMFQLDGIENVDYGIHSTDTTKWHDLRKNYGPYNISTDMTITQNSIRNYGAVGSYIDTNTRFGDLNDYTIEIVFNRFFKSSSYLYSSSFSCVESGGSGFQHLGLTEKFNVGNPNGGYYDLGEIECKTNEISSYSGVCNYQSETIKVFTNGGINKQFNNYTGTRWNPSMTFHIFVDAGDTGRMTYTGDIHSIRFYNRSLSDTEVLYNYSIDVSRFNIPQ